MKILTESDINKICNLYKEAPNIEKIATSLQISSKRVKRILQEHNIAIHDSHKKTISKDSYIEENLSRFEKGCSYIAVSKIDGTTFKDYLNKGGALTHYIQTVLNIEVPSLFKRKKYFHEHGFQWYEQWFDIRKTEDEKVKKCPYCSWETTDINNKSGMFLTHLLKDHNITSEMYAKEHPEDQEFCRVFFRKEKKKEKLKNESNFVICPICNEKLEKLSASHFKYRHNCNYWEIKEKYPNISYVSNSEIEKFLATRKLSNMKVSKKRFISRAEGEINKYIAKLGFVTETNRQILIGKEIDILIPSAKLGIEYDGLRWHTEWFGKKDHMYHLNKSLKCNEKGYGLIHIFEDEYENKKELVLSKIKHILKVEDNEIKVGARKCTIKEITKSISDDFLERYHIQGKVSASIYYGAYYNDALIGVMTFKKETKEGFWELSRYATDYHYICQGLGGKLFKHFIKEKNPVEVKSFADRRWTISSENNLYTKLGFVLEKALRPDYKYYNEDVDKFQRFHKFGFRKQILHKRYNLPLTMTETQMVKELGYDRIWDCGLFKYVWRHNND